MTESFENETKYLEMAIQGSLEAFNSLVTYYQTAVYNTALRIMCDEARADDITQTAFINAWKHIGSFSGTFFKPWILRITINACYDELRRLKRHPEQELVPQSQDSDEENEDIQSDKIANQNINGLNNLWIIFYTRGLSYLFPQKWNILNYYMQSLM